MMIEMDEGWGLDEAMHKWTDDETTMKTGSVMIIWLCGWWAL
jgi:hypothetical protein